MGDVLVLFVRAGRSVSRKNKRQMKSACGGVRTLRRETFDPFHRLSRSQSSQAKAESQSIRRLPVSRTLIGFVAIALGASCESDGPMPSTTPFAVRFAVANQLVSPVTIAIDGTPYVILTAGKSTSLTVPSNAQWLTWTSAKAAGANGLAFPDDISEVRVAVSGIGTALEISNV